MPTEDEMRVLKEQLKELEQLRKEQHKTLAKAFRACLAALSPPSPYAEIATLRKLRENKAALVEVLPQIIALLEKE
jgi:hypothetical protein